MGGKQFLAQNPIDSWGFTDYFIFGISMSTRLAVEFVIVFFVLSGFSIAHSLRNKRDSLGFYKRRLIRIYPPYIIALIWAGLVYYITYKLNPDFYTLHYNALTMSRYTQMNQFFDPIIMLKNLIYIPMKGFITQFWSLSHEAIFYIIAPFIFLNARVYNLVSPILFIFHLIFCELLMLYTKPDIIIYDFLFIYNFFFYVGQITYFKFDNLQNYLTKFTKHTHLIFTFVFLFLTYIFNFTITSIWSFIPASIFSVMMISYFLRFKVEISWLKNIGKHSYTLYITHVASIMLYHSLYFYLTDANPPEITSFFVFIPAIFICLLMSKIIYNLVEKRTKLVLDKLRR